VARDRTLARLAKVLVVDLSKVVWQGPGAELRRATQMLGVQNSMQIQLVLVEAVVERQGEAMAAKKQEHFRSQ
jgi:hypothetical protein